MVVSVVLNELSAVDDTTPTTAPSLLTETGQDSSQRTQGHSSEQALESDPVGSEVTQAGVKKAEVVTQAWTERSLYIAYLG